MLPEMGETTQEMEAIMQAADDGAEAVAQLLDTPEHTSAPAPDGIDDVPDALYDEAPSDDAPSDAAAKADEDSEDENQPTEPAPDEEIPAHTAEAPAAAQDTGAEYKRLGLYLHVPFCKSKCAYCDFYSTDKIGCVGRRTPEEMKLYCRALHNNMRLLSERTTQYDVDTVFIGGGTPTALPPKLLLDIVRAVEECFYLEDGYEFTVEMNPATANARLLKKLRRAGVNRLSIGLQSAHDHELAALSRVHTAGEFAECFQMAREAGFDNINVDVMYGIPEQTHASFMETLAFVAAMKPEHLSMYNLRIEEGTPFGERRHLLPLPDEDAEVAMYYDGIAYLESVGLKQYEISNFARPGRECRHNLKYWRVEEYIGCGPAAHSYFGGRRFSLKRALAPYCRAFAEQVHSIPSALLDESYLVDRREEVAEYLMLRLRLCEGIDPEDFYARFGGDFNAVFGPKLQCYVDQGLMTRRDGHWAFTPQGMMVSNTILARIIPFETKHGRSRL